MQTLGVQRLVAAPNRCPEIFRGDDAIGRVDQADETERQWVRSVDGSRQLGHEASRDRGCDAIDRYGASVVRALNNNVGTRDADFDRQPTASVYYAADLPVAEQRVADVAEILVSMIAEPSIPS